MFDRIACLIKGHDLRVARYRDAYPSWVPSSIATYFDGTVKVTPPWISGFMHYSLYSVCERCGSEVSISEDCGLPIVEPEFMKEARRRQPSEHGGKETAVNITQKLLKMRGK